MVDDSCNARKSIVFYLYLAKTDPRRSRSVSLRQLSFLLKIWWCEGGSGDDDGDDDDPGPMHPLTKEACYIDILKQCRVGGRQVWYKQSQHVAATAFSLSTY